MKEIFLKLLFYASSFLFIISCGSELDSTEEVQKPAISVKDAFLADSKPIRRYIAETPKEWFEYQPSTRNLENDKVGRFFANGIEHWKELDAPARDYISHNENNVFAHEKVHACVAEMLDMHLLRTDGNNKELQEAIAFYTDKLVEQNTYELGILAESLKRLEGYWPSEKIVSTIQFGFSQSEKFSKVRGDYKFLGDELLDKIEHGGKQALESLTR